MKNIGYIRVTTKRKGPGPKPVAGETVMHGDRGDGNVFGNPHVLHNHNDPVERARVIALHKADFAKDLAQHGPMFREVQRVADLVINGSRIAIQCWCRDGKGRPCHLDHVVAEINRVVKEKAGEEPKLPAFAYDQDPALNGQPPHLRQGDLL